jgi:hypothetical protein
VEVTNPVGGADSQTLVSPAAPAFFHLVHESLPIMGAGSLGSLRSIASMTRIGAATDVLPGVDGGHRGRDHDHEAEDAKERVNRNTCDEEAEAGEEPHTGKCRTTPMDSPYAGPAESVDQLGILGRKRGFHLLEKPLLLI